MLQYNIHTAKTHLSSLVDKAVAGEPFIIAKSGRPLVTVTSYEQKSLTPRIGFLKGQIIVPDDFDHMEAETILHLFEVSHETPS
jgi:prevent-host-death family protein